MAGSLVRNASWVVAWAFMVAAATSAWGAPVVNLYYDPLTGNLKLQNTTAGAVSLRSYDILTLGDGTLGAATPDGRGYLNGAAAAVPAPTPSFVVSNTEAGLNGLASQVFAGTLGTTTILTLAAHPTWSTSNPIGPVGSYFDLGNVAATAMSQSQIDSRFITSPDLTPGNVMATGSFLYDYEVTAGEFSNTITGPVVGLVPEPSVVVLGLAAIGLAAARGLSRRARA